MWVSIKRKEEERRNVIGTSQFGDQERLIEMVRICGTTMEVEGSKPRRHLGRQWLDDVSEDMKRFGLSRENALSWRKWRRKTEAAFG